MQTIAAIATIAALTINGAAAGAVINSAGTPTSCGQNTCCIPACTLNWSDSKGCSGQAQSAGACSNTWKGASETSDTGVDICDGSGAFFCTTDGGIKVVYVVNRANEVSAALFPRDYKECTLSGQCAPCPGQGSCQDPVFIGNENNHNCMAFAKLLTASNVNLQPC